MRGGLAGQLAFGPGHGGEMLAGYALAVIAGFLLPQLPRPRLLALFALWLLGRAAVVAGLAGPWLVLPNVAFALCIAVLIVPRFMTAAKKLRNMATGPLVGCIALAISAASVLLALAAPPAVNMLYLAVTLLAGLMLFMGARVLVPALSGAYSRRGERLLIRVQPRLEGAMLLCLIAAAFGLLAPVLHPLAGAGAIATGVVSWLRLLRWRIWRRLDSADLWGLGLGYAWVASGMLMLGVELLWQWPLRVAGLHAITVGGLGTLSLNIMGRTWLFRQGVAPNRVWALVWASGLVSAATLCRILAIMGSRFALNWLAAACWSLAFVVVLAGLWLPIWLRRLRAAGAAG